MMLDVPTVPNLSAAGLASTAKMIFNDFGFSDDQLEGLGWDGEYVKKRVKDKLLDVLEIDGMSKKEKEDWVTEVWEPAHQLELVTKDVKDDEIFLWFKEHIQILNDTAAILGIGKGLEQSIEAAAEVDEKFYKLKSMSDTRFSAYFEGSISNFEKRMETNIAALRKRTESTDKKVSDKAAGLLRRICSKQFFLTNLGLLDIYRLLGSSSKELQTVEQFPWVIPKLQQKLIKQLEKMEGLQLSMDGDTGEIEEIDQSVWESIGDKIDDIMDDKYVSAQTVLAAPGARKGRSAKDIPFSQSVLITVENRLTSLVRNLKTKLKERLDNNPTPDVIKEMGRCLDLEDILEEKETVVMKENRDRSLRKVLQKGRYEQQEQDEIVKEYEVFKTRINDMIDPKNEDDEILSRFKHLIFQTHTCHPDCVKVLQEHVGFRSKWNVKVCSEKGKVLQPRQPKLMKLIHLICKEPSMYSGIENFLHLFLR